MARRPSTQTDVQPDSRTVSGTEATRLDPERRVHIVLCGLMGAGKSTVGHLVANELGRPFVDSDAIVALRTGHQPPGVVQQDGVGELHAVELAVLRDVLAQHDSVVFAAAASVVDSIDRDELAGAWCVWLDTSPAVLATRVARDHHERPLVGDDPGDVLEAQHDERAPRGRELAALTIATDDRTPAEVTARICDAWRAFVRAQRQ